jgi:hypothetical protein
LQEEGEAGAVCAHVKYACHDMVVPPGCILPVGETRISQLSCNKATRTRCPLSTVLENALAVLMDDVEG